MLKAEYGTFAEYELKRLIPKGSFASYICRSLGSELNSTLELWDEESNDCYGPFRTNTLYELLESGWALDHEWFEWTDKIYRDDNGAEIPLTVPRSYSGTEQMAAYGLYLLSDLIHACGPLPDEGHNENGWTREGIKEHEAECLIQAYQALGYARILGNESENRLPEKKQPKTFDFSAIGKIGANKRHAPMQELRAWAVKQYQASNWPSANKAAFELRDAVIEHGRLIGARLIESNAQRTIAEWFRKAV